MTDEKYRLIREKAGRTISVREYDCDEYFVKIRSFADEMIPKTTTFIPKNPVLPRAEVQNGKCLVFFQSGSFLGHSIPELVAGLESLQEIIPNFCGDDVLKK